MSSVNKYHDLPPGVSGVTRGYLVVTVDEILWLVDTEPRPPSCHVRAEWWGSRQDQQVVFAPVDVRNFVQNGLMIHSYPVNTGKEKLRQYFMDASPLTLSLYADNQREALGQAYVILADEKVEGYFPVLSDKGDELATIHVKLDYVDSSASSHEGNNTNVKNVKNSRVTFPTHVEEITFQVDSSTANSKSTKVPERKQNCEGQKTQRTQEDLSFLSSVSNTNSITNPGKVRTIVESVHIKISNFSLKNFIFDKLFEGHSKEKLNSNSGRQTLPKIFVFINFTLPGKKEATFCTRLSELNKIEFNESKLFDDIPDDKDLQSFNIDFDVSMRIMGLKSSVPVGRASIPLRSLFPGSVSPRPASVFADVVANPSLFKYLGVRQCLYGQNVGQMTIVARKDSISQKDKSSTFDVPTLGTNVREVVSPTIPKMPPIKSNVRKITPLLPEDSKVSKKPHCIIANHSSDVVSVMSPVFIRLGVFCTDEEMSHWANIRIKWWTGRQCYGFGSLECSEAVLKTETEGRFYNRQSLSSLLDNYLVLELWRYDEIVGIGRVPTHGLHGAAQSWRGRGVTCYDDKVEIVSVTTGQVMGHFRVILSLDDRDQGKTGEKARADKSVDTEEDATQVEEITLDNEEHSVHEDEASENNNLESHANALVHLEEVRISRSLARVYCSLPGGSASSCFSSDDPVWDVLMVTVLPSPGADKSQSQMIMRLWCADTEIPDMDRDKMFGFVSVDCSPLQLGFPYIRGWYNIIDWLGKPKGQVKITIKPNSSPPSCLFSRLQSQNVDDLLPASPSYPSPRVFNSQPPASDIADTEGESLSFMELALSNHLKDLNLMTNKLGKLQQKFSRKPNTSLKFLF